MFFRMINMGRGNGGGGGGGDNFWLNYYNGKHHITSEWP